MTIASEITRLQNDKAAICTAIENKWVTVGNVTLDDYASCIDAIPVWEKIFWFCYLVVWGWWAWRSWCYWAWWWGWGAAICGREIWVWCLCVTVWAWWTNNWWWWYSCISFCSWYKAQENVCAKWGCVWWEAQGGASWNWNAWGCSCTYYWRPPGWWGWWAWWAWCGSSCVNWWKWWNWITYCWIAFWGGWGWWASCRANCSWWAGTWWWWNWWCNKSGSCNWGNATCCGWGWGGASAWTYASVWWSWWGGAVLISYPCDLSWGYCWSWWDCCFVNGWYCVHMFTSNWTFTTVS